MVPVRTWRLLSILALCLVLGCANEEPTSPPETPASVTSAPPPAAKTRKKSVEEVPPCCGTPLGRSVILNKSE